MITHETTWPAPAKLNLFLYITGRRETGYHDLQTLFQFVDYHDQLRITANLSGQITISPSLGIPLEDNLIWKAANALKLASNCSGGAHIEIDKYLPMGGGLGGGSSNAATTLVALNHLWQTHLSDQQLAAIGLSLGADVPVFVHGQAAFAEGVGEKLIPMTPAEKWYLILRPPVSISTAEIFSHPELTRNTPRRTPDQCLNSKYANDCEKIVRKLYPEVDHYLSWLLQYAPSRLTGTGSCIFAEFSTESEAKSVLASASDKVSGFVACGCNISPLKQTLLDYQSIHI